MVKNTLSFCAVDKIPMAVDASTDDLFYLYKIFLQMEDLCVRSQGYGISAPQVGIPLKIFVAFSPTGGFNYYLNCSYEGIDLGDSKKQFKSVESCLSLKDRVFEVDRFSSIKFKGFQLKTDADSKLFIEEFDFLVEKSIFCVVIQHEIDHQKGILISDIGKEIVLI